MKITELRIGNLVYGVSNRIEEVIYILPTEVNTAPPKLKQADFLHKIDEIQPIPLTEEWLEDFGFEKQNGIMCWEMEGVEIVYETLAQYFRLYPKTNKILYVHQLQNLYFALTGEELILKES